jgi:hypothetical protein
MSMAVVAGVVGAGAAVYGVANSADAQRKALHAQQDAANAATNPATNGTVDINALDAQARQFALQNAAQGQALTDQYNPGVTALRAQSIGGLSGALAPSAQTQALANRVAAQAGTAPSASYSSPLLNDAVARAQQQLALGGTLDLETQNAATRGAFANAGSTAGGSGGLGLGRDLQARDLGLTSLQLQQQRLQNASQIGAQQAAVGQGNANLSMQGQLAGQGNLFNSANFLSNLDNGNFARQLNAATLTQNIANPATGLDPGSVTNLAVGNAGAKAAGYQQAGAINIAGANQQSAAGGQMLGVGAGLLSKYGPGLYSQYANPGAGSATTYSNYLANNPSSSAAAPTYTAPAIDYSTNWGT